MDFDQLRTIWDTQNQTPLYALNEPALQTIVQRRNHDFSRRAARRYQREILTGLSFGVVSLVFVAGMIIGNPDYEIPASRGDVAAMLVAGALWFGYAAQMFSARRRQKQCEADFANTLRGDIERGLAGIGFQIGIARSILWWGHIPAWAAGMIWIVTIFRLKGAEPMHYLGATAAMGVALAISVWAENRAITRRFDPRRRELESLREKLVESR